MTLNHNLHTHFPHFRRFRSTKDLEQSSLYWELRAEIDRVLNSYELSNPVPPPPPEPFYRVVAWNIERGIHLEGILHLLKQHPTLSTADVLMVTETDIGMARSGNRNIARELAAALRMNYFFAPSYLNLAKGSGIEHEFSGDNALGIHGNAIVSRYPIEKPEVVVLKNAHDKMKGREKRLGSQRTLMASIAFPGRSVKVVCAHLDSRSQQRHRAAQMETILKQLESPQGPTLIGGDWNTSTYDSSTAFWAIFGFWVRVIMGTGNMIRNHYPHPDRWFERKLFQTLEKRGFDYRQANQTGGGTLHYSVKDIAQFKNLREWVPRWCFHFIEWALAPHGGECHLKLDWFATRGLPVVRENEVNSTRKGTSRDPHIVGPLQYRGEKVSDHDAIMLDFRL